MLCALIAATLLTQQGHEIRLVIRQEENVRYKVWGTVFRHYVGGKSGAGIRTADVNAIFTWTFQRGAEGFDLVGKWDSLELTLKGKPLPDSEQRRAAWGKWSGAAEGGPFTFTINGNAADPPLFGALGWPLVWSPFGRGVALRIGQKVVREVEIPIQPFMEDDPVGSVLLPVTLVFEGPDRDGAKRTFRFRFDTDYSSERGVSHPEQKNLKLKFEARIGGSLVLDRETGKIETVAMFSKLVFTLEKPGSEFPFAKSDASIAANWQKVGQEKSK